MELPAGTKSFVSLPHTFSVKHMIPKKNENHKIISPQGGMINVRKACDEGLRLCSLVLLYELLSRLQVLEYWVCNSDEQH